MKCDEKACCVLAKGAGQATRVTQLYPRSVEGTVSKSGSLVAGSCDVCQVNSQDLKKSACLKLKLVDILDQQIKDIIVQPNDALDSLVGLKGTNLTIQSRNLYQ